jgi:hypothetical protein
MSTGAASRKYKDVRGNNFPLSREETSQKLIQRGIGGEI